jgi:selenium metabolism protein YedF
MDEMKWEKLAEVHSHLEADVIKSFLEAQGIPVELFQESVGRHIYPTTIDGLGRVQLFVPKDKLDEARKLYEDYQNSTPGDYIEILNLRRNNLNNTVIQITSNGMGKGDQALQYKLIAKYLALIQMNEELPNAIVFYTDGVKLVVEGSPVLDELRALENKGVRLVLCSTCLEHYGLTEKVQVGIIGGMTDIIEAQVKAEKVITL